MTQLEVIDKYGADALRFSVLSGTTMGNDIRYMPEKLDQASNFANKIWNAAKFIIMNRPEEEKIIEFSKGENTDKLSIEDKWILNKLNKLVVEITNNIEKYDLGVAIDKIYSFLWNEFCDWYIEMAKIRLYNGTDEEKVKTSYVLDKVFRTCLKLLHPFMPFVTSKIYDNLVKYDDKDLMVSSWPEKENINYEKEEEIIERVKDLIVEIRNVRSTKNIHPSKKSKLIFVTDKYEKEIKKLEDILLKLGFGTSLEVRAKSDDISDDSINIMVEGIELYMPLEGLIDKEEERKRLEEEKKRLEGEVARCEKMLSNPGFVNKAPKAKVEEEQEKLKNYKEMLDKVIEKLK